MSFSAALQSTLIEPPTNLLVVMFVGLLILGRSTRHGWTRMLGWVFTAGSFAALFGLAMPVTGWLLLTALERDLPVQVPAATPPAAIVILSADELRGRPGGLVEPPDIGALTLERVRAGAILHKRTGLPVLVTGGELRPGTPPIANAMARVLTDEFNTPTRWREDMSETTWDNARLSAAMLRADGIASVYVVTHAWHMRRSVSSFAHFGIAAIAAPTHFTGPAAPEAAWFLPSVRGWMASSFALHEWIGIAWYAWRGGH